MSDSKKCANCGKEFKPVKNWRAKIQKYCSRSCANKFSQRKRWAEVQTPRILASIKKKNCGWCNKEFLPDIKNRNPIFCSLLCQHRNNARSAYQRRKKVLNSKDGSELFWHQKLTKQVYQANRSVLLRYFYPEIFKRRKEVGVLTVNDWKNIKKKFGYKCAKCYKKETPQDILEIDHDISIVKKGKNLPNNIQPLCSVCHQEKSKQEKRDWRNI